MRDKEFLQWIHDRLERIHGESPYLDYMHKLRAIIAAMPPEQETPNVASPSAPPPYAILGEDLVQWLPGYGWKPLRKASLADRQIHPRALLTR